MAIPAYELENVVNNSINKYYQNLSKTRIDVEALSRLFVLKYLLLIINSKLMAYYIKMKSKGNVDFYPDDWKNIPIKSIALDVQNHYAFHIDNILLLNEKIDETLKKFQRALEREFSFDIISTNLYNWYSLSFKDFITELHKKKVNLSLAQKAEWEDYFESEKKKALDLKTNLVFKEKEIDKMVYELYGLSEEEISIVESA
ncbi:MAG: hypothetical protein IPN10_13655 [Saprospiraceae bacterium]|nr:hypothetical protein [Saprospiraceae bacterium]